MTKTLCKRCGKIHELGKCQSKPKPRDGHKPDVRKFRSSTLWRYLANRIRELDGNTCVVCMERDGAITIAGLSVHHIVPLVKSGTQSVTATDERLLATLCPKCHRQADLGEITAEELIEMVRRHRMRFE